MRLVNLSILAKWRWRLLQRESALWKEVLVEKYGHKVCDLLDGGGGGCWSRNASRWSKDFVTLARGEDEDWFNEEVDR